MLRSSVLVKAILFFTMTFLLAACVKAPSSSVYYNQYGQKAALEKNKLQFGPHTGLLGTRQYYFPCNSTLLPVKYQAAAKAQATYLQAHPRALIQVQGFNAAGGSPNYSLAIGQQRANSVADFIRLQGVPALQVAAVSYGSEIAAPYNGRLQPQDCRVDIVYLIDR